MSLHSIRGCASLVLMKCIAVRVRLDERISVVERARVIDCEMSV